jgi:trigger factor
VKLTVERLPESQMLLDIVADDKEVNEAKERAFRTVSRQIRVPGFRPGKAPRHIIDRLYGPDVYMQEAHRVVVDKLYREAIEQESIIPVGQPSVEITEVEPLAFKVTVPVFPTIKVGDYTSVRVDPRDASTEESEVEEVLTRLQTSNAPWVTVEDERNPKEGDQVTIDLSVKEGDEEFDKPIEDAKFILGESNLFDQLRSVIETMKVGENATTEITFQAEDDNVNERVRGKALSYEITLKAIEERQVPELNDEFAKTATGIETVADLREAIRKDVHQGKTSEIRNAVFSEIIDKIAEGATLELPAVMVDDAIEEEVKATEQRLTQQGLSLEAYLRMQGQSEEAFREELRPGVARRLRNSLLLREIAEQEGIAVNDEDIDREIYDLTAGSENAQQMRDLYSKEGYFRRMLRDDLFDRKLTDRVVEIATEGRGAVVNGYVEPEVVEAAGAETGGEGDADAQHARDEEPTEGAASAAPDAGADRASEEVEEEQAAMGIAAVPAATDMEPAEGATDAAPDTGAERASDEASHGGVEGEELPRGAVRGTGGAECVEGYPIKGNASSMIYHAPGSSSYDRTVPEMCFASEEDAVAAGYRPSKSSVKSGGGKR